MRLLVLLLLLFLVPDVAEPATFSLERGSDLQAVIDYASDGDTILLSAKEYETRRTGFTDPLCGNCADPQTEVAASYGFTVKNKGLVILGADRVETILVTNAGYGLYLENAGGTTIRNLTVTGGKRDDDSNATDAAIVVRRYVVVGIGGVCGREGAEITLHDCRIINGGWDGIALYRGATALVTDCVIKDGRGAGIGVTWDAVCVAYRNEISGFWKGLGSFGTSSVVACNNLVHDNLGWGLVATGTSSMEATNNVIHHNGNCGVAPWSTGSRGRLINNIITQNGWREQWVCPCVGVWNYGDWAKWTFRNNIVWGNETANYEGIWDQTGIGGNQSIDPAFPAEGDYSLSDDSPAFQAGDSLIFNLDGSRSHIGLYGGPQAWSK